MSEKVADSVAPPKSSLTDPVGLSEALRAQLRGGFAGDVRFDNSSRALYATDGSNYRQVPIGVVLPRDADDVLAAISVCRDFGAPLLCRGGGTSLAGQCCNVAVVLDFTKYMGKILEIDPERRLARVQPGVVLDHLRNAAEKHHLTFGPDPASHDRCTIGGMIGNNSCGVHSVMAGKTDDNIEALDVVTYEGTRLKLGQTQIELCGDSRPRLSGGPEVSGRSAVDRAAQLNAALKQIADQYGDLIRKKFPNIPRRVSGYNLNYLLPKTDSTSPARWSAPKARARRSSKPPVAWSKARRHGSCLSSPIPTSTSAPTISPRFLSTSPSGSRASTICSSITSAPRGSIKKDSPCFPKAADGSWSSSAPSRFPARRCKRSA